MESVKNILVKAKAGERISKQEAQQLLESNQLLAIAKVAKLIRQRLHPENKVSFAIDRNINYTNVCTAECNFCAFYQAPDSKQAYLLTKESIFKKIAETIELGGTQILMQGGLHPELDLHYYLDLLQAIKDRFEIHIHSLSPPEIVHIAEQAGLSITETLRRLKEAGLDSLPGGGAEILVDRVREIISPNKIKSQQWLEVMRKAHRLGMKSTATMMFGSVEKPAERIEHLAKIRELQDQSGGFTAFIPWTFQATNTDLAEKYKLSPATATEYLQLVAVARIFLDNIPSLQASWVTQGEKLAQVSLDFGVNDFGSTMIEENVVKAAGVAFRVSLERIIALIEDTGRKAVQRDTLYNELRTF
ncbi:cyclic dehypoxanthinyl futalosine synthase [Fuchsiella alkaliacetigena]|uniref:cyclic dehypoxanthinyl futalosine synthase n=1 Tax=Fuchsiella alkaliacetigena TaxID=957042 RepID=UPI00200A57A3|nr:cyclic dehypoxanthinyl futalosine synthase [Fuchsiella alkaliacetigena]MCK8825920.1 dehypoxanthine futalosine cyclase [Fuchsiella alkaliacetigena]